MEETKPNWVEEDTMAENQIKESKYDYTLDILNRIRRNAGRNNVIMKSEITKEIEKIEKEIKDL